jgi:hypothetical protein
MINCNSCKVGVLKKSIWYQNFRWADTELKIPYHQLACTTCPNYVMTARMKKYNEDKLTRIMNQLRGMS